MAHFVVHWKYKEKSPSEKENMMCPECESPCEYHYDLIVGETMTTEVMWRECSECGWTSTNIPTGHQWPTASMCESA